MAEPREGYDADAFVPTPDQSTPPAPPSRPAHADYPPPAAPQWPGESQEAVPAQPWPGASQGPVPNAPQWPGDSVAPVPAEPWPHPGAVQAPVDPGVLTALPVEERSYPFFYRTPRWRWWRPLVCLLATAFLSLLAMSIPGLIGMLADGADFGAMARTGEFKIGPWGFVGNNVGLALCIPIALLMQWAFFGQRPKWLSSVVGGFRWGWFGKCLAVVLPLWAILTGVEYALTGLPPDIRVRPYTWIMVLAVIFTTPFQSAGEEYLMRGLEQRMVASYFKPETIGFVVATLVSSVTFMLLHGAGDPWLNLFYFCFGAVACWLGWKTGGLEASVAIHVVNNVLSEALLPFTDFSGMFNREKGVGDPSVLILVGVLVVAAAILTWLARPSNVAVRTAPGRAEVEAAYAHARSAWAGYAGGVQHP